MATRTLTEVFILMRNNAMQSRHIYSEQHMSDRMSLVGGDAEAGLELRRSSESRMPPQWVDGLEEAQYSLTRLRAKLRELETLHTRHLHRPTLDDSSEEEQQIEALTQEITRMFGGIHRLIQQVRHQSNEGNRQEKRLSYNVVSSLVTSLQELSTAFRRSQNSYLRTLNSREERSRQYFGQDFMSPDDWEVDNEVDNIDQQFGGRVGSTMTQQQLLLLEEENTKMVAQRDQEVRQIVRSIVDLNHIFKDLAHMVADQGTVLDRIDYNIEMCQVQVQQGYQQLQKADTYQRKNRKMMCILCLASVTIVLLIILIVVKS
ncbi:syntaxin-16 [Anabrus simplex]|uniref:syntaxin-16 n=1 Tax=Anabrus simplex TaxID=316456 RepID=UPI0035A37234